MTVLFELLLFKSSSRSYPGRMKNSPAGALPHSGEKTKLTVRLEEEGEGAPFRGSRVQLIRRKRELQNVCLKDFAILQSSLSIAFLLCHREAPSAPGGVFPSHA